MKIFVDMDGVLCDYDAARDREKVQYNVEFPQSRKGFFIELDPIKGAIDGIRKLAQKYEVYILTSPSVKNSHVWTEKADWIEKHLGFEWLDRLIITKQKGLLHQYPPFGYPLQRTYLIDDHNDEGGRDKFFKAGDMYWFSGEDADWDKVTEFFGV